LTDQRYNSKTWQPSQIKVRISCFLCRWAPRIANISSKY